MYQRKVNLKNIKSKFGYGNEKDKTYESTLSDKKKIEFQFQTFIESISKYNSYVSRLVDMGFNLKTLDVIFDIKYLNYQDEYHKVFPNANLQSSKGGAPGGGGGIPMVPTPDQLAEMIDGIFGTRIGPTATANRNNIAQLGNYINVRNTELGQIQALVDYTSGTKLQRNNSLKTIIANIILQFQEQGIFDFEKSSSSIPVTMELYNAFNTTRLVKYMPKPLRDVILKIVNRQGSIKYNGTTYVNIAQKTELKQIVMNEVQKIINNLKPDDENYFNQKMGFAGGGGGTMTVESIMNMLSKSASTYIKISDGAVSILPTTSTTDNQSALQQLIENILNMLSTSTEFQQHMGNSYTGVSYSAEEQIFKAVNYLLNKIATGGDRSFYVISEYIKKWMRVVMGSSFDNTRKAPLPYDPNAPADPNVPKGEGDEVRKPTGDMVYKLVENDFPEMDDNTRNQLIKYIISINDNYNSTRVSSSTETQQEKDAIELNYLNLVLMFFDNLKSEVEHEMKAGGDLDWRFRPNTVWENIFETMRKAKDISTIIQKTIAMSPVERAEYIIKLGREIYDDIEERNIRDPTYEARNKEQQQKVNKPNIINERGQLDETEGVGAIDEKEYDYDSSNNRTNIENFEGNIKPNKDVYQPEDGASLPSTPPMVDWDTIFKDNGYPPQIYKTKPAGSSRLPTDSDRSKEIDDYNRLLNTGEDRSNDASDFNKMVNEQRPPPPKSRRRGEWKQSTDYYNEVAGAEFDSDAFNKEKWPGEDADDEGDWGYEGDEGDEGDAGSESSHNSLLEGLKDMFNDVYSESKYDSDNSENWVTDHSGSDYNSDGSGIYISDDDVPELELTPEQQGVIDDMLDIAGQGGEDATPHIIRAGLRRMIKRLRDGAGRIQLRRRVIEQLNKIRARINGRAIRFNWGFVDPESGITYRSEVEAVASLMAIQRDRVNRLPRDSEERRRLSTQPNIDAMRNAIKKKLQRVIEIEYNRTPPGGGGDPDDPDDFDDFGDDEPIRRRRTIPISRVFKLLVAILATFASGFTIAEGVKWLDEWISGGNVEIPKDNTPVIIPKDKKPKPPSSDDSFLPKKFLTIGHTEWFDSVGLSAVIDTYNGFVNEYNKARDDGTISDKDLTFMDNNIRKYYDKFAKVTNTPLLSDLQEAKRRYDGLRAQYDNALENGMDINSISVIYTELRQSMTYLDRMTDQFLKMEGGVFGTYKNKDDPDVTVDDADSNIRLVSAPAMNKQARKNKLKSPSDFVLSKGMKERIERKLNRKGFGDGILQEEKLFNDFSIVTPPPIREHNSLTNHNKRHEIMQYAKARSAHPPIKTRRLTKITGQKPRLNNVVQFDDILDDAYYNSLDSTKLQNPYQTKSDNIQQFHKSKLYNPEYSLQKAFENKNNKNMSTGGDMIRSGAYENVNKDQYYQLGTIQYEYNEKLNKYPMTREKPMTIDKSNPKQTKPIRHRRIPNSYSLK